MIMISHHDAHTHTPNDNDNDNDEQVVEAELKELEAHGVTPATTYPEFKKGFLASRPMGYGSHSLLARGLYALQVRPPVLSSSVCVGMWFLDGFLFLWDVFCLCVRF